MTLKTPQEVAQDIINHINSDNDGFTWLGRIEYTITNRDQAIATALLIAMEGEKYPEPEEDKTRFYNKGIDQAKAIVKELLTPTV